MLKQPGCFSAMGPFPAEHGAGFGLVEIRIRKPVQRLLGGNMVVQDEQFFRLSCDVFQNGARIAEIYDNDPLVPEVRRRWTAVMHRKKASAGKFLPYRPGRAESIRAVGMVKDNVRGMMELWWGQSLRHDDGITITRLAWRANGCFRLFDVSSALLAGLARPRPVKKGG